MTKRWLLGAAMLAGVALSGGARAGGADPGPPSPPHRPPDEAFQACASLAEGAPCAFTMGDRQMAGICRNGPQGEAAACVPAHPPGRPHGPPPEAVAACASLAEGAPCAFTMGDRQMAGTCRKGPQGEAAACAPARPEGPPPQ